MNFVKLYIGDYQRDTGHLSIAEHGAYLLMLQHYYATERPLPTGKALHRLLRAENRAEREAIDEVVRQFWSERDGGLVNGRADEEIRKAEHQRTVNRELGKRGGRPPRTEVAAESQTESVSEAEPIHNPNQTPDTRHQTGKDSAADASVASPPPNDPGDGAPAEPKVPSCPVEQIVADYHATLPQLPRVLVRNDKRDGLIRARWREVFAAGKAADRGDGLALFHEYFAHVAQSRFLTGRAEARNGSPPFVADLEWLMRPTNFAKVVEGRYHRG
jgi:uncharacterized protein YdaU (DUF1376 family)